MTAGVPAWDVVVLSWNRARLTLATVGNILRQRGVDVTVWVVDQGSDRGDLELLRAGLASTPARLVEVGANRGVGGGRNHGIRLGRAGFVASIDNDAEFESDDALALASARFAADPQLGAIAFRIVEFDTGADDLLSWVFPRSLLSRAGESLVVARFCGAGHALRRSAWNRTEGYDEALHFYWEETDLSYQLIESGYFIRYEPGIRVRHKVAREMRVGWRAGRFYHQVRGAVYLEWKYHRRLGRLVIRAAGYLVKGAVNHLIFDAVRGVVAGLRLAAGCERSVPLGSRALGYVRNHDEVHRGHWISRIRQEALGTLPGTRGEA